jgi:hypothetical protein
MSVSRLQLDDVPCTRRLRRVPSGHTTAAPTSSDMNSRASTDQIASGSCGRAPQRVSWLMQRIKARISGPILGRPGRRDRLRLWSLSKDNIESRCNARRSPLPAQNCGYRHLLRRV